MKNENKFSVGDEVTTEYTIDPKNKGKICIVSNVTEDGAIYVLNDGIEMVVGYPEALRKVTKLDRALK